MKSMKGFILILVVVSLSLPTTQQAFHTRRVKIAFKKHVRMATRSITKLVHRLQGTADCSQEEIIGARTGVSIVSLALLGAGCLAVWWPCGKKTMLSMDTKKQDIINQPTQQQVQVVVDTSAPKPPTKKKSVRFSENIAVAYTATGSDTEIESPAIQIVNNEQSVQQKEQNSTVASAPGETITPRETTSSEVTQKAAISVATINETAPQTPTPEKRKTSSKKRTKPKKGVLIVEDMPEATTIAKPVIKPIYNVVEKTKEEIKIDLLSYALEPFSVEDKAKAPMIAQKLNMLIACATDSMMATAIMEDPVSPGNDDRPMKQLIKDLQAKYTIKFDDEKAIFYVPDLEENVAWYHVPLYVRPGEQVATELEDPDAISNKRHSIIMGSKLT